MKQVITAGGLIKIKNSSELKIPLIFYKDHVYSIPKGKVNPGEAIEDAAIREVKEELGLKNIRIIKELGIIKRLSVPYKETETVEKIIHVYKMETDGKVNSIAEETYEWVLVDEALNNMKFPEEKDFIREHKDELYD